MSLEIFGARSKQKTRCRGVRAMRRSALRRELYFESLERRDLLTGWFTTGQAWVWEDEVHLGRPGSPEDSLQPSAIHGATLELPPAETYRVGFDFQLASWDSYNNAGLGDGKGYWDSFSFSVTEHPYADLALTNPIQFPGRGFTWGGTTYGDSQLATVASSMYQTFTGDSVTPRFLNVMLDTLTEPDADDAYPSWGRVAVHANDVEAVELRMEDDDSIEFDYRVRGYDVPVTAIDFFWAEGPEEDHIIDATPVATFGLNSSSQRLPGLHTAQVSIPELGNPPEGATHLAMVSREFLNEMIVDNNHTALDLLGIAPLHMEVVGGNFQYNASLQRFEADGTIFIGLRPLEGADFSPLVQLEGSAWYDRTEIQVQGRFFPAIGPLSPLLFEGAVQIKNGSTRSVTVQDFNPSGGEFQIGGFEIQFTGIQFRSDGVGLQGNLQLPRSLGHVNLSIEDDHWLVFSDGGTHITGGRVEFPDVTIDIQDILQLDATGLAVEYIGGSGEDPNELKIQGKVNVPSVFGFEADFAGDNFIRVAEGDVDLVGRLSLKDLVFVPKVWELKEAFVKIDTIESRLAGGGTLLIPAGVDVSAEMEFLEGQLDAFMLGVGVTEPINRPIATTGAFLQSVMGRVENLQSDDPLTFSGLVGFTYGPEISVAAPSWLGGPYSGALVRLDVGGSIDRHHLAGTGQLDLISVNPGSGVVTGNSQAELNWTKEHLSASAVVSMLGGLVMMETGFFGNSSWNIHMGGAAQVRLPDLSFVPFFSGQMVGDGRAHFQYLHDASSTNDYVAAWGTVNLPISGPRIMGVHVDFAGNWKTIGSFEDIPPLEEPNGEGEGGSDHGSVVREFQVASGATELVLHIEWANDQLVAAYEITAPDGRSWTAADLAGDDELAEIPFFESATTRAIIVDHPQQGTWRLEVAEADTLGDVAVDAFRDQTNVPPEFVFLEAIPHADRYEWLFDFSDPDSQAVADFYVTSDPQFRGGSKFASRSTSQQTVSLHLEGLPAGEYYVYAVAQDDVNPPILVGWEDLLHVGNNAPVIQTGWMDEWPLFARIEHGLAFEGVVLAEDIDADSLTYSLDASAPDGAEIDQNGVFSYTPPLEQLSRRWHEFTLEVADQGDPPLADQITVTLLVDGQRNVTGSLAAGESRWWTRDVRAGQNLIFVPHQRVSSEITLQVFNELDELLFEGPANTEVEIPVESDTAYRLVLTAPDEPLASDLPFRFELQDRMTEDGRMFGTVNLEDEPLRFVADFQAGQYVMFDWSDSGDYEWNLGIVVEGPDGRFFQVDSAQTATDRIPVLSIERSGSHRIYVTPMNDFMMEVDVELRLLPFDNDFALAVGAETTVVVPAFGTVFVPLDVAVGKIVQIGVAETELWMDSLLFDSAFQLVDDFAQPVDDRHPDLMLVDGLHYLLITSREDFDASLTITLSEFAAETETLEYGVRYADEFGQSFVRFPLSLEAGQMLFVDALCPHSFECGPAVFRVAEERILLNVGTDFGLVATEDAEYELLAAGLHDFTVHLLGESERLTPDLPVAMAIPSDGAAVAWWVDAPAGQRLQVLAEEPGLSNIELEFFTATGRLTGADHAGRNVYQSGPVIITFSDVQWNPPTEWIERTVTVQWNDFESQMLEFGTVYAGPATPGESDEFDFFGYAGQQIYFNSLDSQTFATVTLTGPLGEVFWRSAAEDIGIIELATDGPYVLSLQVHSDDVAYRFKVDDLSKASAIGYQERLDGHLKEGQEVQWFSFDGLQGQQIALMDVSGDWTDADLQVFLPNGQFLTTGPVSVGVFAFLPETGSYLVAVVGTGQEEVSYDVQWRRIHSSWQNPTNPLDVNSDGLVTPLDALMVINYINLVGAGVLPQPNEGALPPPFVDVAGSGEVAPLDVLLVINHLNRQEDAEGEEISDSTATGVATNLQQPTDSDTATIPLESPHPSVNAVWLNTTEHAPIRWRSLEMSTFDQAIPRGARSQPARPIASYDAANSAGEEPETVRWHVEPSRAVFDRDDASTAGRQRQIRSADDWSTYDETWASLVDACLEEYDLGDSLGVTEHAF